LPAVSLFAGGLAALAVLLLLLGTRPDLLGPVAQSALARLHPRLGARLAQAGAPVVDVDVVKRPS
jgi:hypothetical protein